MTDITASLLTPPQLAEWLQLPLSTLYSWRTQGIGPPGFKVGRGIRYRRSDVERWLERQAERDAVT
jgi:excisionase family DNA binding protein